MTSGNGEYPLTTAEDAAGMLQWLAKRKKLSLNALVGASGTKHAGLVSFATGSRPAGDLNLNPLLRVVSSVGYEFAAMPKQGTGIVIAREGAEPLMVVGIDGGRIDIAMGKMSDVARLLNTMAAANDLTVTGLVVRTGINSTSLVSFAKGSGPNADIRVNNLLRLVAAAGFRFVTRPVHKTLREARMALARN